MAKVKTFDELIKEVNNGMFKPIYVLMGTEAYFTDKLLQAIIEKALPEDERDFCLSTFYGGETTANAVINAARSFPMGERMVVVLKNGNELKDIDELAYYLQNPQPSTLLVVINKNGTFDRRKNFMKQAASIGEVFESAPVKDRQLPGIISDYFRQRGLSIDMKSLSLLADSVGTNLTALYGEMNKLATALPEGVKNITPDLVEEHVGISKEFNMFELQDAIAAKDTVKAFKILKYFDSHEKLFPPEMILPGLFGFFSKLMMANYAPRGGADTLAQYLGMPDWVVRNKIYPALRNFPAAKVLMILTAIRDADEKVKGLSGSSVPRREIMKQLMFFIMH